MANEIDIARYLNTQGFTVKLYDEATTDLATKSIYSNQHKRNWI